MIKLNPLFKINGNKISRNFKIHSASSNSDHKDDRDFGSGVSIDTPTLILTFFLKLQKKRKLKKLKL